MPVDTSALVALSDLAAPRPARQDPPAPVGSGVPGRTRPRGRLARLAAAAVGAGLVCGLVLPGPAEAGAPAGTVASVAPPRTGVVAPVFLASSSPFAAVGAPVRSAAVPAAAPGAAPASSAAAPTAGPPRAAGYVPTLPLPAGSGVGRRIVYSERRAHVWVVDGAGRVLRDYAVTGRAGRPGPGVYHVYSKSPVAVNPGERLRFEYMVRFAVGVTGARIGFHTIPRRPDGTAIQSEAQLGRAIGAGGCVRQARTDAVWLYGWSRVGDTVVVLR